MNQFNEQTFDQENDGVEPTVSPLSTNPAIALLGTVLGLTSVAFMITAVAGYLSRDMSNGVSMIVMFLSFPIVIALPFCRKNQSLALALFYGLALCFGIGLGPVLAHYAHMYGSDIIVQAAGLTAIGMAIMGCIAWMASFDFRRLDGIGFSLLLILVIGGMLNLFMHFMHPTIYSWATLVVFTILTLGDFARIRYMDPRESAIEMAVAIYLDTINIFLAILQILGGSRSSSSSK